MAVQLDGFLIQNTTYDYDQDYEYKDDFESKGGEVAWIPVMYLVVLVVGLLGNVPLLVVLVQKVRSWSVSDIFILHLSIADILLLVTLPFWALQAALHHGWNFGLPICKISGAVFNINFYCGIFLLACISRDRSLSTARTTRLCFNKKPWLAHLTCLSVWLISLLLTIPDWIFLMPQKDGAQEKKCLCVHNYSSSKTDWQLWSRLLHHILGFLLPTVTIIICCFSILLQLQHRSKNLQKQRTITMAVTFLFFWMPYNITLIVDTYRNSSKEPGEGLSGNPVGSLSTALTVTAALGCVHACLRPLLYLVLCGNFRRRALATLRCAADESQSSLWELGVGENAPPAQRCEEPKEMNPLTSIEQHVQ